MAISLKQYETKVTPKAGTVGVEGSVSLAMDAAGGDQLVSAEFLTGLGDAAVGYLEKKKEIKDAADSSDYSTRLLRLQTDLESAKVEALQSGVHYRDIYSKVYTPMLNQFKSDTINAGYSKDVLTAALQNFDYDQEVIRQKEFNEIERIDLANYNTKLKEGLKDHYSLLSGTGQNPLQDDKFNKRMQAYAGRFGKEAASLFTEQLLFEDINNQAGIIAASDKSLGEKLTILDELELNAKDQLTPDKAKESMLSIKSLKNDLLVNYVEVTDKAQDAITEAMNNNTLTTGVLEEVGNDLPPEELKLVENHISRQVSIEADLALRLDLEPEENESLMIMDMVSRYASGIEYSTGKNKPLNHDEVFEMAKDLTTKGQTVFYTMMKQAMRSKQKAQTPIATYQERNGLSPAGLILGGLSIVSPISTRHLGGIFSPYKAKEDPITFDVTGGDFVEELFYYSRDISPSILMDWLKVTTSEFEKFKREYPNPTKEQYQAFQAVHFKPSVDNKIQTSLRKAIGTSASEEVYITPEEMQIIKQSKGN